MNDDNSKRADLIGIDIHLDAHERALIRKILREMCGAWRRTHVACINRDCDDGHCVINRLANKLGYIISEGVWSSKDE